MEIENSKIKTKHKAIMKKLGFGDINPAYDSTLKCFTVIKVLDEVQEKIIPISYTKLIKDQGLKGSVRNYEGNIWIFKIFKK